VRPAQGLTEAIALLEKKRQRRLPNVKDKISKLSMATRRKGVHNPRWADLDEPNRETSRKRNSGLYQDSGAHHQEKIIAIKCERYH